MFEILGGSLSRMPSQIEGLLIKFCQSVLKRSTIFEHVYQKPRVTPPALLLGLEFKYWRRTAIGRKLPIRTSKIAPFE